MHTCIHRTLLLSGVGIYEGIRVEGVDVEGGRVTGVRTNKGNISCEIFINSAGQVYTKTVLYYTIGFTMVLSVTLLPRTHAQGVKQPVCMSVVVVVVRTKIASLGDLGR